MSTDRRLRARAAGVHPRLTASVVALGTGIGDGLVGRVPIADKYSNVHTVYRLGALSAGAIGLAAGWQEEASMALITASLALLGSRVPAALSGGGAQQFG